MLPTVSPSVTGVCWARKWPFCCCATKTKLCPPWRVTASTGTTAIGVVLQMTRALIIWALRRISGVACTGAFTRIPCKRAIHLRRKKIDLGFLQQLAAVVHQLHIQPLPHLAGALRGNVDIGFEILVLVHRGQHVGGELSGRNIVAHMHGMSPTTPSKGARMV